MSKSRPFTYNTGSLIPGTEKFGNLTVGIPESGFESTGLQWWNGPDEELGYVIAQTNVDNNGNPLQPTQIPNVYGSVGFFRTDGKNTTAFINLTNAISGQNFTTATQCKTWLESNNRWTSWSDFATEAIVAFKARVLSSQGEFEAETCMNTQLTDLDNKGLLDSASLIVTPNGYKENLLFAVKPDKVGTNLLLQSEGFTLSPWILLGAPNVTRTANAGISPIGTNNATLLTSNSTSTFGIRQSVTISPNTQYVFSCWVRSDNPTEIRVDISDLNNTSFNLTNTWQRIQVLGTYNNSYAANLQFVDIVFGPNQLGSSFFIWGAQMELGSTATDYISTTDRAIINGTIGDLTVTRATNATRVNEQGLIENVPYNLVGYSQEFENTYWFKTSGVVTVVQNVTTAPDGTLTADQIKTTLSNGELRTASVIGVTSGQEYTWSAYVKSAGSRYCSLTAWSNDDPTTRFDLTNISIVNETGPVHTSTITDVGNGWRRITITRTISTTYNGLWFRFYPNNNNGLEPNTDGVYLWGAQIVQGAQPKDYFTTTNRFNIPRLDYTNGSCPSILVEPQRTNLIVRSEEFENASWTKNNTSIIPNATISPSGLMNADKLVENNLLGTHNIQVFTGGTELRTNSIFVKAGERSRFILWAGASGYMFDLINLTTTPGNNSTSITNASIKDYGNGWYRCSITTNALTNDGYTISLLDNQTNPETPSPKYQGDGVSGLYIWGAQRENAPSLTSYIPTTTATVTRNADVISNTNAYNLISQTEGTIFIDYNKVLANDTARNIISLNDGTSSSNLIEIWDGVGSGNLGRIVYIYYANNLGKVTGVGQPTISPSGRYKICLTYIITPSLVNIKFFINGVKLDDRNLTYDAFSSPLSRINIGNRNGTNVGVGSHNLDFILKTRITDAQAIQLTTL